MNYKRRSVQSSSVLFFFSSFPAQLLAYLCGVPAFLPNLRRRSFLSTSKQPNSHKVASQPFVLGETDPNPNLSPASFLHRRAGTHARDDLSVLAALVSPNPPSLHLQNWISFSRRPLAFSTSSPPTSLRPFLQTTHAKTSHSDRLPTSTMEAARAPDRRDGLETQEKCPSSTWTPTTPLGHLPSSNPKTHRRKLATKNQTTPRSCKATRNASCFSSTLTIASNHARTSLFKSSLLNFG